MYNYSMIQLLRTFQVCCPRYCSHVRKYHREPAGFKRPYVTQKGETGLLCLEYLLGSCLPFRFSTPVKECVLLSFIQKKYL